MMQWILLQRLVPEIETLGEMGLRIGLAGLVGFLAQRGVFLLVGRIERWMIRAGSGTDPARQRAATVGQIFRNLATVLVVAAVVVYGLGVLGWDVWPLLGAAGVLGIALGLGAQSLVRDVIAGIFIIAENQFAVGDLIEVNGKAATVEALTVRSATLRDFNGYLHFVPNGELRVVVNRSRGWNRLAVDVPIAADSDVERVLDVCRRVAAAFSDEPAWRERLLDDIQVWGVEALGGREVQVRMVVRSEPGSGAAEAARELRRRAHRALVGAGIEMTTRGEIEIRPAQAPEAGPRGAGKS